MSAALRQRRSRAATALAEHPRRAQLGWDDLADWPAWADTAETTNTSTVSLRVGALWHAGALRRCIHGPTLKQVQQTLGDSALQSVLAGAEGNSDGSVNAGTLPGPQQIDAWLQAQGAEVMLATLPSPLLRLALRERLWPQALPQLPMPDAARAARTLQAAQMLAAAGDRA